ncbi:MAG: response regulator [Tildeniella torsiva UHER 1998/13D]|jgi:FixJ family two-component response regulator|nr:response regulator [Tildeniella torsiva UHER 1998/13D]
MLPTTVLVIHHDEIYRATVSQFLESASYAVLQANTLEIAQVIFAEQHVDVVILELVSSQVDEVDIIRKLIQTYPYLRIIVTASHSSIDEAVSIIKAGAIDFIQEPHGYVQKPFSARTIQSVVRKALESPHPWAKLEAAYETLLQVARDYISRQDYNQAIGFIKEAFRCDPARPEALNLLGEVEEFLGKRLEALKKYRAAIDLDPTYQPAQINLHRATTRLHTRPKFGK